MDRASVAVLLISKDFLTSKFIQETEVPYLLKRRREGHLRVIPLFVRSCAWQAVPWLKLHLGEGGGSLSREAGEGRGGGSSAPRLDLGRLPIAGPLLIGREAELARLDTAWEDPGTHVLTFVAFGGMGSGFLRQDRPAGEPGSPRPGSRSRAVARTRSRE